MRKNFFRAMAIALSAATVVSLAAGCSKGNAATNSAASNDNVTTKDGFFYSKSPITISILFSDNQAYPKKDSWTFFKTLAEKTNVTLDAQIVAMSDYPTKRSSMIAAGVEPQVIPKTYPGQEDNFVTGGQILPISDYINQMPYLQKNMKDWKIPAADLKTITQGDGKYYIMPLMHEMFVQDYSICMRTDILKKNNIAQPESWDEFEAALKKLKTIYPDIVPYSDRWQLGVALQIAGPAFVKTQTGVHTTDADFSPANLLAYDATKDSFSFYPTAEGYKQELTYFNKLITEGLMDKESLTQSSTQATNKFETGKSFAIMCNASELNTYRQKMNQILGSGNYEIARLNVPAGPAGKYIQGNRIEGGVMITQKAKQDKNFKTILQFTDWLFNSDKAQEFCKWGIEGETYTKTGDTFKLKDGYVVTAYGLATETTNTSGAKDLRNDLGFANGNFVLTFGGSALLAKSYMTTEVSQWADNVNKTRTLLPNGPKIAYDEDTQDIQNNYNTALKDTVLQWTYQFILGQKSITNDWNAFVSELKNKNSDKYLSTAVSAYAKQKK